MSREQPANNSPEYLLRRMQELNREVSGLRDEREQLLSWAPVEYIKLGLMRGLTAEDTAGKEQTIREGEHQRQQEAGRIEQQILGLKEERTRYADAWSECTTEERYRAILREGKVPDCIANWLVTYPKADRSCYLTAAGSAVGWGKSATSAADALNNASAALDAFGYWPTGGGLNALRWAPAEYSFSSFPQAAREHVRRLLELGYEIGQVVNRDSWLYAGAPAPDLLRVQHWLDEIEERICGVLNAFR